MTIHHTVHGDGPSTVVLLHGGTGDSQTYWAAQVEELSKNFRLLLMDHRGFGRSDSLEEFSIAGCASDVVALLDEYSVPSADLVGLSLGGAIAIQTALARPDRVGRLVLADTFSSVRTERFQRFIDYALIASLREGGHDLMFNINLIFAHGERYLADSRDSFSEAMIAWRETEVDRYVKSLQAIRDWDVDSRLGEITAPSLVIWGSDDIEVPRVYAERLAAGLPNAILTVIPEAGHKSCADAPLAFNKLVRTFLLPSG